MLGFTQALGAQASLLAAEQHVYAGLSDVGNLVFVTSAVLVVLVIIGLALAARKGLGLVPNGMAALFEFIYEFVDGLAIDMLGKNGRRYVPFCMSIFLFVLISNWSSLVPVPAFDHSFYESIGVAQPQVEVAEGAAAEGHPIFEAPTISFNTTFALAVVTFVGLIYYGLRKSISGATDPNKVKKILAADPNAHVSLGEGPVKGFFSWLAHYLHPTPLLWKQMQGFMRYALVPVLGCLFVMLNIVEELGRLISLSIRLYGNLFGEHTVHTKLNENMLSFLNTAKASLASQEFGAGLGYGMMGLLMWGCCFFATCIGTLAGFIQAFVFFVLTLSYLSHVVCDEH